MEIQCPSCQKKLSIGDQFAGQLVKCPACSGVFMAPSLNMQALPVAAPVSTGSGLPSAGPTGTLPMPPALGAQTQAAAPDVIPFSSEPPARPSYPHVPPLPRPAPSSLRVEFEEEPPGPPSDFKRSHAMRLSPDVLRWVGPVALALLFVLSFFSWAAIIAVANLGPPLANANLWNISFGSQSFLWITYLLLTLFVALPLAWAKLLMEMNLMPTPDVLRPYWYWRSVVVGAVVAVGLILSIIGWLSFPPFVSTGFGMFLALRVHLIALIAYGLEFWLADRKKKRLPLPELTVRW